MENPTLKEISNWKKKDNSETHTFKNIGNVHKLIRVFCRKYSGYSMKIDDSEIIVTKILK